MGAALIFGLIGSSALVIGGAIGAYWRAPQQISGVLLAFASGTLISALAFELFPEAVHLGGPVAGGARVDRRWADLRRHQHRARLVGRQERR